MVTSEEALRRLTIADPAYVMALSDRGVVDAPGSLDARGIALIQLGALIATGAPAPVWQQCVSAGRNAGLSPDDMVGALFVLLSQVGVGRTVAAAPNLARALGYDIDDALFGHQDETERTGWPHH